MIYPDSFEQKLGFDQIRDRLESYCLSPIGARHVASMSFQTSLAIINVILRQTLEFRMILERGETFPTRHYYDPTSWLEKASIEGNYLESEDFLQLANAIQTIMSARSFLIKAKESYPQLHVLTEPLTLNDSLSKLIFSIIEENGVVKDSASAELSRIRKKLREEQGRLRKLAESIFRQAVEQKWVPDGALPTVRDGRIVIPVQAEHKRKMRGFILDESATGQTVFMEPAELLDSNNEIRDLEYAERREVIRILRDLTDRLRADYHSIVSGFEFLGMIDFIRAKATFAIEIGGDMPELNEGPLVDWRMARHPLLLLSLKGKREVVPLSITLTPPQRMLLISGPNAGGKSVALKTLGLLQYMLQCGLLIPLSASSRAGIFDDIFLDIGDQQSIENDLSTYSSHLRNMNAFVRHASSRSLVLLDELGSGTDPNFGGAIAQAILRELLNKKVWGAATTHYYNLKLFAANESGIVNAAMRFDDQKLEPLFVLDVGKPGSSFALEIASKTGLPHDILQEAEQLVGKDLAGFEKLVRELEQERSVLRERIRLLEQQEASLKETLARYESLSSDLESRKKEIITKAKAEATQLLQNTNREIEKTIRHIRENNAQKKETLKVRNNLKTLQQKVTLEPTSPAAAPSTLEEGDRVRIIGQDGNGVVLQVKGKHAVVQFGTLKSTLQVSKLEKLTRSMERETASRLKAVGINIHEKQAHFNPTLDVRGKRVEEVIPELDQFMDTAILLGHGELRVLHGKGGGVLRKVVRDHIKRYKQVASFADEHIERGGDGITVIVLK